MIKKKSAESPLGLTRQLEKMLAQPAPKISGGRLLMLTHRLPYPPNRGDRIRSFHLLKELSGEFEISLACLNEEPIHLEYERELRKYVRHLVIEPISPLSRKIAMAKALLTGSAITPSVFYRKTLARMIQQWHDEQPFDVVLTFCTGMIEYARLLTQPKNAQPHMTRPRHVLDLVDVDSVKWDHYAQTAAPPMRWIYQREARKLRQIEAGKCDAIDAASVVNQRELKAYHQHVASDLPVRVVGNGVDVEHFLPLADVSSPTLAFVGVLNYKPNVQAMVWFVDQIMPELRKRFPQLALKIIGRSPDKAIKKLALQQNVQLVGPVDDVHQSLATASCVIAPLQIARGVQNKVLEAMASSRVVICSPQAAGGIEAIDGRHLLIARNVNQWVDHITRTFQDAPYRQTIARAACEHVQTHYSWRRRLSPMLSMLVGGAKPLSQAA